MSSSRLLDFFVLEATDYIDRLDVLLSSAHDERPDASALTAQARLLRGSATMARQSPIADLASAVERIGRAVRDEIIVWSPELQSALVAAVDDLKILMRAVRSWGPGDDRRTESRISQLVSLYPQASKSHPTPPSTMRNASFIASESAQLATALDNLVAHPSSSEALAVAVHRLSSLRGVAAINDTPPLAQALSALDDILRPVHLRNSLPDTQHLSVLISAVQLLRRFSQEIAIGGTLDAGSSAFQDFHAAVGALGKSVPTEQDSVIPIERLNFEDGKPQIVSTSRQANVSPAQRFRLEVAGPCELLRHQVLLARSASSEMERAGAAAEMRGSLRVIRSAAEGFSDTEVIAFVDAIEPGLNPQTLSVIDEFARTLMDATLDSAGIHARLRELQSSHGHTAKTATPAPAPRPTPSRSAPPMRTVEPAPAFAQPSPPATRTFAQEPRVERIYDTNSPQVPEPLVAHSRETEARVPEPAPVRAPAQPMTGVALSEMLSAGISGLSALQRQPLSEPAPVEEDTVVPIEQLLYRGRSAISRALEIRDGIRARSGAPHREELDELFELLDLAVAE